MPYYHYTDSLDSIIDSGVLRGSDDGNWGPGVYFTNLPPSKGQTVVGENNWGAFERTSDGGKMAGVIKIYNVYGDDDFEEVGSEEDRDVYLYRRDELVLSSYSWAAFDIAWRGNSLKKLNRREEVDDGDEEAEESAEEEDDDDDDDGSDDDDDDDDGSDDDDDDDEEEDDGSDSS